MAMPRPVATEDEVDRIVGAWRRARPDMDAGPLEVLSRVGRLSHHLDAARRAVLAGEGLEPFEFDVLTSLRRAGPPHELAAGRLAAECLVSSGTMTNRIDRLAERGLARRAPDPSDGRSVRVQLTDYGLACADRAITALVERERSILEPLGEHDRQALATLLRRIHLDLDPPPPARDTDVRR